MKILVSDKMSAEGIEFLESQPGFTVVNRPGMDPDELLKEVADAHALIVRSKTKVKPEVIAAAKNLRVVGRAGAGVDNIDLEAATRRGIVVMNTPGGNSVSAGEHAFALLISLARKIPFAHASLKSGQWNKAAFMGSELQGKTLGIVGAGKIGSVLAKRALGFEMSVLVYDPFISESYAADLGVELCDLDELYAQSDFISLHSPMNEKTKHMINRETLAKMKGGAILVNAARGGLINEADLIEALESGQLAGAALDVFENEPNVSEALRNTDNVIFTPHIAGSTLEAQAKVGFAIAVQITNYLKEDVIVNAVNFPSMSTTEMASLEPYIRLGEKLGSLVGQICRTRVSEIGLRYYGDLPQMSYKPLGNYILKSILAPVLSEEVNAVNARKMAEDRGISIIETVSNRERAYSNLISIQLRGQDSMEWVEGAILREGNLRLVSVDGISAETQLGDHILFIRNDDTPGVIGQLGTVLGNANINVASFVLGRSDSHDHAVGVVNTDSGISEEVLEQIGEIDAVQFARIVRLSE
ncbi:MAG: phosphoglycerate dehydrogenase [Acidobacteriota bacterium]|nr:MAG: phosphoglycerate dehydrogenase [Acidobacteriota bacterium]